MEIALFGQTGSHTSQFMHSSLIFSDIAATRQFPHKPTARE